MTAVGVRRVPALVAAIHAIGGNGDELQLLQGLADQADSVAGKAMAPYRDRRTEVAAGLAGRAARRRSLGQVLRQAEAIAAAEGSQWIRTEHVLCALLRRGSAGWQYLTERGVDPRMVRSQAATEAAGVVRPTETTEIRTRASGAATAWCPQNSPVTPRCERDPAGSNAARLYQAEAIVGVAVIAVTAGAVSIACQGTADPARQVPVRADSTFRIGSLTKLLTALATLVCAERRVVDLDVPVTRYLHTLAIVPSDGPTLRQLLTHTGGAPGGAFLPPPGVPAPSFLDATQGVVQLTGQPGQRWVYSNVGYAIVGQVLEDSLNRPFPAVVRDLVLEPLGMGSTTLDPPLQQLPDGYWIDHGDVVTAVKRDIVMRAAGGALSTASDLGRLLAFLTNPAAAPATVISEAGLQAMFSSQQPHIGSAAVDAGIGTRLTSRHGQPVAWHPGAVSGFPSAVIIGRQVASAVLSNTETLMSIHTAASTVDAGQQSWRVAPG
jgi:CubicO group peptidase (beta-lactamase class C family)